MLCNCIDSADQPHDLIGGEAGHFATMFVFEPLADLFPVGGHRFDQNAVLTGLYDEGRVWFEPKLLAQDFGYRDLSRFIHFHGGNLPLLQ